MFQLDHSLTGVFEFETEVLENLFVPVGEVDDWVDEDGLHGRCVGQKVGVCARITVKQLKPWIGNV
jgi:hypothetical protein